MDSKKKEQNRQIGELMQGFIAQTVEFLIICRQSLPAVLLKKKRWNI